MPRSETKDFITESTIGAWAKLPWTSGSFPESLSYVSSGLAITLEEVCGYVGLVFLKGLLAN